MPPHTLARGLTARENSLRLRSRGATARLVMAHSQRRRPQRSPKAKNRVLQYQAARLPPKENSLRPRSRGATARLPMGIHLQNNSRQNASGTANTLGASRRITLAAAGLIALTTPGLAADCVLHTGGPQSPAQCAGHDAIANYHNNYAEPSPPDVHVTVSFFKTDYGLLTEACEKRPGGCSWITTKTFALSFSNTGKGPERDIHVQVLLEGAQPIDESDLPYMPAFDPVNVGTIISPYERKNCEQYAKNDPVYFDTYGFTVCSIVIPALASGQVATYKIRYHGFPVLGYIIITSGTLVISQSFGCYKKLKSCITIKMP
jgi:hypothetical protein